MMEQVEKGDTVKEEHKVRQHLFPTKRTLLSTHYGGVSLCMSSLLAVQPLAFPWNMTIFAILHAHHIVTRAVLNALRCAQTDSLLSELPTWLQV
jgi:hypothetical protein